MKTAEERFKEMYDKWDDKDKMSYEQSVKQPEYKLMIDTIKQAQIDAVSEMEKEVINEGESYLRGSSPMIDKLSIAICANTIRAKIEGGNPIIKTESPICQFCGKYKTTQGNGILHQLCECGRIEGDGK